MSALWQSSPRFSHFIDSIEANRKSGDAIDDVTSDLMFGGPDVPNTSGAFSAEIALSCSFASQALVGPPPGVLPTDWFRRDDLVRIVLAEMKFQNQTGTGASASAVTSTLYFANWPYYDDENSRAYGERIRSVPRYNRAIDRKTLRGRYTSSIGSLELDNADGALDYLLDRAVDGSTINFYVGDAGDVAQARLPWLRSQFVFMFSAVVVDITAPSWKRIEVSLKDTSLLLDSVTLGGAATVGGSGVNAEKFRPYVFGYVRQVEAVLKDASTLTYALTPATPDIGSTDPSDAVREEIVDVRDKGVSVPFTKIIGAGEIQLQAPPVGMVLVDLYVERNRPRTVLHPGLQFSDRNVLISDAFYKSVGIDAGLIAAGKYGGASANFEYQWTNDYPIGFVFTEPTGLVDALGIICDTGNCYWAIRRDGYFTYGWLRPEAIDWYLAGNFPSLTVSAVIGKDDLFGDLRISRGEIGAYDVQGYANANWLDQQDFAGSLSPQLIASRRRKGVYNTSYLGGEPNATAYLGPDTVAGDHVGLFQGGAPQLYHRTMKRSLGVKTLISCTGDTTGDVDGVSMLDAWASVRRSQFLPWLEFIDVTVDLSFFQLELGSVVQFDASFDRFDLAGKSAQVCSIDLRLTEGRIGLGLVRRRPAFTQEYV